MNYKVMKRPMFKMGGTAASQGTGITSGLDEKVNMSDGRANYATGPELRNEFLTSALDKYRQRQEKQQDLANLIDLQALAKVGNVLSTEESNNPFDIIKNIAMSGSEIALPALSAKRTLELKSLDPTTDLAFAKALKSDSGMFSTKLKSQAALKNLQVGINELKSKITKDMPDDQRLLIEKQIKDLTEQKRIFLSGNPYLEAIELYYKYDIRGKSGAEPRPEDIEKYMKFTGGNAEGGMPNRVERQMGSPMMGEQPMNPMAVERKDAAMETQSQGNDAYAMLRSRLPQEIPDDVVRLIAYNKEAFADFASIKNQEDVTSFNQKYNVSMNIDVSTV
jgi:hypothetical protein|tara:strand:- start:4416 stop:5420 length:1005 start_codon:yes stop_codon:yes gene_type:complete